MKFSKKFQEKFAQYCRKFIIYFLFNNIFFSMATNMHWNVPDPDPYAGLQIRRIPKIIYRSGTLITLIPRLTKSLLMRDINISRTGVSSSLSGPVWD
jgi:hypothetical protein